MLQKARKRQKLAPFRAKRILATTELQQLGGESSTSLHDSRSAVGAAVEVSHVSMAFGDRQVLPLTCLRRPDT